MQQQYAFVVILYADALAAENAFHESCDALHDPDMPNWSGWSLIWQVGQNWYGELSTHAVEMPPEEVAHAVADVLDSSAHVRRLFDDLKVTRLRSV